MSVSVPADLMTDLARTLSDEWPDARLNIERFPSGAAFLDVWREGRFYVLRYSPTHRSYDLAEMTDEHVLDSGPCEVFDDLDAAAERLREIASVPASQA